MRIDIKGTIVDNDDGWIYDWFGIENTTPKKVIASLARARGEDVDIYLSSGGGSVIAGSDIYSELRAYKGKVRIHITGLAASAASVIACAAWSDISPTAMFMVHNSSCVAQGDYHYMDKASDFLQTVNDSIAAAYVAKSGMSQEEALRMMDEETWLTAEQAVDKKLVDAIAGSAQGVKLMASVDCTILPAEVIEKMRNTVKPAGDPQADLIKAEAQLKLLNLKGKIV